ncbi:MAG: hypothetical protein WKG01_12515 [Kofleriaceae bacterium]
MTRKRPPTEPPEDERKERVIHTRVPESLETELRQRAQDLGISVSNLVRNVLGHAFGLVGDVVADSQAIARAARAPRPPAPPAPRPAAPAIDDVLGWQQIVLGKNALCARCNAILPKGHDAATGIAEASETRLVICLTCLAALRA